MTVKKAQKPQKDLTKEEMRAIEQSRKSGAPVVSNRAVYWVNPAKG